MNKAGVILILWVTMLAMPIGAADHQNEVLLQTGSVEITTEDMIRYIEDRVAAGSKPEIFATRRGLLETLETLVMVRKLGQEAREYGITMDEQLQWQLMLERDRILHRAHVQKVTQERLQSADWEAAAREIYTVETDRFTTSPRVHASHILVSTEERDEEKAGLRAQEALTKAQKGESFEALVAEYSDDPSAETNQGDLGFFGRGQMVPAFDRAAFALKEGELSDLVKTRFGYHIIKLHQRQPAGRMSFEEVKTGLIEDLQKKMARDIKNHMLAEARSPVVKELNEEQLEVLEKLFSAP